VILKEGAVLTFSEMSAYLREQKMALQYIPERLQVVRDLPRTPSGKIQKFKLREMAAEPATPVATPTPALANTRQRATGLAGLWDRIRGR